MAACPSCGVPVIPGYVRCPKCHKALPIVRFRGPKQPADAGGTALEQEERKFPIAAIVLGVAAIGAIVGVFAMRGSKAAPAQPAPEPTPTPAPAIGTEVAGPSQPETPALAPVPGPTAAAAPNAGRVANDLERQLSKQHLWSTVEITGDHADVRSASCAAPAMSPAIDTYRSAFKAAGLTRVRCLEQSGRVVFDRNL